MKSPQRSMNLRRVRLRGSNRPSQLLLPRSCGHVGESGSASVVVLFMVTMGGILCS